MDEEISEDLEPNGYYCYEEKDGDYRRLYLLNTDEAFFAVKPAEEVPKETSASAELIEDELLNLTVEMMHQF